MSPRVLLLLLLLLLLSAEETQPFAARAVQGRAWCANHRRDGSHHAAVGPNDPRERYYTPENRPNVPADYSAQQLTLNRIRDCAVANKLELMRIMRSGECFSRAGRGRMDGIVEQLVVACPLADPATSTLLDGKWVKQGVVGRQTHVVAVNAPEVLNGQRDPTVMTYNWLLGGFLALSRRHHVKELNGSTVTLDPRAARMSVCGSLNFKIPRRPLVGTATLRILYLDSDLMIIAAENGGGTLYPEVFLKPRGSNEQLEVRMRTKWHDRGVLLFLAQSLMCFIANPFKTRSPFRFRDRAAGIFRDAAADVTGASKLIIRGGQRGSGSGIIGEVDALSANAAPWATEEDVLKDVREGCAQNDISSDFVVGDLLSGKVTRKLSKIRKSGEKKNNE